MGICGGDLNCVTHAIDCSKNAAQKISPSLNRLISLFEWEDSYRSIHQKTSIFSRYYKVNNVIEGARLDRCYQYGGIKANKITYKSISFSDHLAMLCSFSLPLSQRKYLPPSSHPPFKIPPHVVDDELFKALIQEKMVQYNSILDSGADILIWWENLVKPGIAQIARERKDKLNHESNQRLNFLHIQQCYHTSRLINGSINSYEDLNDTNKEIQEWFHDKSQIAIQKFKRDDIDQSEKIRIYHLSENKKTRKKLVY